MGERYEIIAFDDHISIIDNKTKKDMKQTILELNKELEELNNRSARIRKAIEALQKVCEHKEFVHTGHDSHKNYEKCVECGLENDY